MATSAPSQVDKDSRKDRLQAQVAQTIERLAEQLSQGHTEEYLEVLRFYRRFWRYSPFNQFVIMMQKPDASHVASYKRWQELGRQVRKGASAAWIFVPIFRKERDEATGEVEQKLVGFRQGPVFADTDLEDIETNPLPTLWKPLPDDMGDLLDRFIAKLEEAGIRVRYEPMPATTGGYCAHGGKLIGLAEGRDSRNTLATLIHETAHSLLHFDLKTRPELQIRELEAESVAQVMSEILDLGYTAGVDYLANYQVTPEQLKGALDRIQRTVKRLVYMLDIEV